MVSQSKGKLFFIQHEPWLVIQDEAGRIVNRKVILRDKDKRTCKIRMNNRIKEVKYYL